MNLFLICFISGASFLLSFLLFFHPLQQNTIANRWLSLAVFIIGSAFMGSYMLQIEAHTSNSLLFKLINSIQFLLAPSLLISIQYFVNPTKVFRKLELLHFVPFVIVMIAEILNYGKQDISTFPLFDIYKGKHLLIRDTLPIITCFYLFKSFSILVNHKNKLKLITSNIDHIDLGWITQLLLILSLSVIFWINDALVGLPYISDLTNFVHAGAVFFAAYFSIKQKTIFSFKDKDIKDIAEVLEYEKHEPYEKPILPSSEIGKDKQDSKDFRTVNEESIEKSKPKRLKTEQITTLAEKLSLLMEKEKLFLDNDLDLPTVAEKLGINIHETSFLINEVTKDNFYNFINKYRVEEAKRLLASTAITKLNILGIAFASGFNSKTTFNTTFKKIVGISPSQFSKEQKKIA